MARLWVPLLLLVVSVPLILRLVPPNHFYGLRTPRTFSSETVWYSANQFTGFALAFACVVWIVADYSVPAIMDSVAAARRTTQWIGWGSVATALAASFLFLLRFED